MLVGNIILTNNLQSQSIQEQNLNECDLVVLSCCYSAVGTVSLVDGISGLTRAFIRAGASCVVSSLWAIPDSPSKDIMNLFYTFLLEGYNKAEALRKSMIELKNLNSRISKWAGFNCIGNIKPIFNKKEVL